MAELPTEESLANLSWYGAVGYATRCARRAQPLYVTDDSEGPESLERVIKALEEYVNGTGSSFRASSIFTTSSFPGLTLEMAAAVYASRAAGDAAASAGNDLTFDNDEIVPSSYTASNFGRLAYVRSTLAPNESERTEALERYFDACGTDFERLREITGDVAGELGTPIAISDLGELWPGGAPSWPVSKRISVITRRTNTLIRFDQKDGPIIINPDFVVLIRPANGGTTEVVLNLGNSTSSLVLQFPIAEVQAKLTVAT